MDTQENTAKTLTSTVFLSDDEVKEFNDSISEYSGNSLKPTINVLFDDVHKYFGKPAGICLTIVKNNNDKYHFNMLLDGTVTLDCEEENPADGTLDDVNKFIGVLKKYQKKIIASSLYFFAYTLSETVTSCIDVALHTLKDEGININDILEKIGLKKAE